MSNVLFYTHTKEDLKRTVKMVIDEIRKTEIINSNLEEDDRLSQKEAASFLGISVTSIISWKKQEKIPYFQIGKNIFFSRSELLKIARKNQNLVDSIKKA